MSRLVSDLKQSLMENGFSLVGDEKMKICIETKKYGYFGFEIEKYLARHGIVCEFCDRDFVVMMITPQISVIDLEKLKSDLLSLPRKTAIDEEPPVVGRAERKMTVREAVMSPSCVIDAEKSLGRVLSFANVSCPPAIPIVVCGEVIDEKAIECFKYYGIDKCRVVE
jgi:arginine/lysine/ornithine decarboxylase